MSHDDFYDETDPGISYFLSTLMQSLWKKPKKRRKYLWES